MNVKQILQFAETCQEDADRMSYLLMEANRLAVVQSVCLFNIFWLSGVSPVICSPAVIDFICRNTHRFNCRMSVKEFLMADLIISNYRPKSFDEFSIMFINYKKQPGLFSTKMNEILN